MTRHITITHSNRPSADTDAPSQPGNVIQPSTRPQRPATPPRSPRQVTRAGNTQPAEPITQVPHDLRLWLDELEHSDALKTCHFDSLAPILADRKRAEKCFQPIKTLLEENNATSTKRAWTLLFVTTRALFRPKPRDGHTVRQTLKHRYNSWMRGQWRDQWDQAVKTDNDQDGEGTRDPQLRANSSEAQPYANNTWGPRSATIKKAKRLAKEGELSRAVATLEHTDVVDPTRPVIIDKLYQLHEPHNDMPEHAQQPLRLPHDLQTNNRYQYTLGTIEVPGRRGETREVSSVEWVRSRLPNHKAASLTGTRYEHLKVMPVELLSKLVTSILNNDVPDHVRPILTAAKLIAISKTSDPTSTNIRPIAVGEAIRRFAGKVQMAQEKTHLRDLMVKVNALGVAVPGGIEYAYHSARIMLDRVQDEEATLTNHDRNSQEAGPSRPRRGGEGAGGICQIDFERAYQTFSRTRAIEEIQKSSPQLLRFYALQYSNQSELKVMWRTQCVARIWSRWGTQQGDVMGGVYFFYGTVDFARTLRAAVPEVMATWIVDDLTLSGDGDSLLKAVEVIATQGPSHGLVMASKASGRMVYGFDQRDPETEVVDTNDDTEDAPELIPPWASALRSRHGFTLQHRGLPRLLGAPLGRDDFVQDQARREVIAKMQSIDNLKLLQDTQLEYLILKHCYAARVSYLTRLVPPHLMQDAIREFEGYIRPEIIRLTDCRDGSFDDFAFSLARLPISCGGLALQDLAETAPGAFCASMGAVARLNEELTALGESPATGAVQSQIDKGGDQHLRRSITALRDKLAQGTNTINTITCPDATDITEMPPQKRFSQAILKAKAKRLLDQMDLAGGSADKRLNKLWLLSQQGYGAGAQFKALPTAPCFRAEPWVFSIMLADRLRLPLRDLQHRSCHTRCAHPVGPHGDHLDVCRLGGGHIARHDKVKDIVAEMHKTMLQDHNVQKEPHDLLPGAGDYRPADVAPSTYPGDDKPKALDIFVGSAINSDARPQSRLDPLKSLDSAESRKMTQDATKIAELGLTPQQVPYEKVVLSFATTGAWGRGAQKWRKDFIKAFNRTHEGALPTMDHLDLDSNWSAIDPMDYYAQRIAFAIAYHRAQLRVRRRWATVPQPA